RPDLPLTLRSEWLNTSPVLDGMPTSRHVPRGGHAIADLLSLSPNLAKIKSTLSWAVPACGHMQAACQILDVCFGRQRGLYYSTIRDALTGSSFLNSMLLAGGMLATSVNESSRSFTAITAPTGGHNDPSHLSNAFVVEQYSVALSGA